MDRNQLIGTLIITLGVIGYLKFFGPKQENKQKQLISVESKDNKIDIKKNNTRKLISDNFNKKGVFTKFFNGKPQEITLHNKNITVVFNTKGATIQNVKLNQFNDYNGNRLNLLDKESSNISLNFKFNGENVSTSDLYFKPKVEDHKITFILEVSKNKYLKKTYSLDSDGYTIKESIQTIGLDEYIQGDTVEYVWKNNLKLLEHDINKSRDKSTINYYLNTNKFKTLKIKQKEIVEEEVNKPVKWVAFKQRFFTSAIISTLPVDNLHLKTVPILENNQTLKFAQINLRLKLNDLNDGKIVLNYFFGPNSYKVLKKVANGFSNNLFLGWPIVKWINKYFTTPMFDFLKSYISNMGIVIIVLVLIIKIILLPLSYKSQISMEKMKLIKPEIDALKEKFKREPKKIQVEQMNLYREMGINPLGGCIPILLQMPMFIAMFNFFPNAIEIRQASFLWAKDLSTYDSIFTLPFTIPLYGNHVSLFTLLMTVSTILSTWSNSSMNNTNNDNSMKMFSYVMPIMFMFILNSFPAALSLYYFSSNIFTFVQQFIIKKFIDKKKLKKSLEVNKSKKKQPMKSRSQARLEKMLDSRKNKK